MNYTVKLITIENFTVEEYHFIIKAADALSIRHDQFHHWRTFDLEKYIEKARLTVCLRDRKVLGFMASRVTKSIFDNSVTILSQDLLYGCPGTRAAYYLMQDFVDFGRRNVKHIITMIGRKTNIKRQSLEKLGFKKLQEVYRLEV